MAYFKLQRTSASVFSLGKIWRFVAIVAFLGLVVLQIENSHKIQTLESGINVSNGPQSSKPNAHNSGHLESDVKLENSETGGARDTTANNDGVSTHKPNRRHVRAVQDELPQPPQYTGHGGGTYVRWGRTTCPESDDVEIVYNGIAGGSLPTHEGGASNKLCLPTEPTWGKYSDGAQSYAQIYGAEYHDTALFEKTNAEGLTTSHNIPCAVCRSKRRTSVIMIPARTSCLGDWHLEYHGYLMAGHYTHKAASEYICIDEAPELDPAGYRGEDGPNLYRVEGICGALPCPQYVNYRDLACSVCSK